MNIFFITYDKPLFHYYPNRKRRQKIMSDFFAQYSRSANDVICDGPLPRDKGIAQMLPLGLKMWVIGGFSIANGTRVQTKSGTRQSKNMIWSNRQPLSKFPCYRHLNLITRLPNDQIERV
jgi:hypothetical protein